MTWIKVYEKYTTITYFSPNILTLKSTTKLVMPIVFILWKLFL